MAISHFILKNIKQRLESVNMYWLTPNAHFFSYTMMRTSYISIRLFRIISIPSKFCYFRRQIT